MAKTKQAEKAEPISDAEIDKAVAQLLNADTMAAIRFGTPEAKREAMRAVMEAASQ